MSLIDPIANYSLSFSRRLPIHLVWRAQRLFQTTALSRRPGYIYVFWDERDDPRVVKIGRTSQPVRRRLAQWNAALKPDYGEDINLIPLFSVYTLDAFFAERLIQILLFAEWLPKRFNPATGERLIEYYRIADIPKLKLFLTRIARYVDATVRLRER